MKFHTEYLWFNTEKSQQEIKHIYLKEARSLRQDLIEE